MPMSSAPFRFLAAAAASVLVLAACASALVQPVATSVREEPQRTSSLNSSRPARNHPAGDDFYQFVNKDWLAANTLPADKASIGAAEALSEQSDRDVRTMIEELVAAHPAPGTIEQKIADLYAAAMDETGIEARGIEPLEPLLSRIRAVESIDDLMRLMGVIGYNSPIGAGVAPSPADPDRNAVWVSQAGLGMPHRGYYLDDTDSMMGLQEGYREYVATILDLIGHDDPEDGAQRIFDLEYAIAQAHVDEDRSLSADESMRSMTYAQLKAYAPGFDWDRFLGAAGLAGGDLYVVMDQTAVADLGDLVHDFPIEDWKLWMEFHIAHEFADYLPKAFADASFDYYSRQLAGVTEQPERWQFAVGIVNTHLGDAVAQLYVKRHFPETDKTQVEAIVGNIRTAFETRMRSLEWMDDETRGAALEKLLALQGMIGYPDKWRDFSKYPVEPGKLVESIYASYEFEWNEQQADLGKPVDRTRWPTHAHVVNAFYNPLGNTFVLPAGILKPPFFDPGADPAVNYGGIGAVIGHEMSHGFDDQGRQFDASGRTFNWWTDETDELFVAKTNRLMRQYNGYCPFRDACVNGLGTLGENIGDLAGLEIAYAAYKLSLGGKEAPVIGGLTGDQRFFTAYASTYRDKVREEIARAMLEGDSHSPSRYRVNGVVRNMDAWYAAFDVKPGDRLYLSPAQRVRIW
jgi:putative endopeptidase